MSDLIKRIISLQERIGDTWRVLQLDAAKDALAKLREQISRADFWSDTNRARVVSQQAAEIERELATWERLQNDTRDLADVVGLAEEEGDRGMIDDAVLKIDAMETEFRKLELLTLLSGTYDSRNAILSFHAGAGGTDANDWVAMLLRMLSRYAEAQGWSVELLDESRGEEAGYKSATIAVRGRYAYGWLRSEAGVHRLVRISPFDAEQMRHTTFALVEVLPEFDDVDEKAVEIDPEDLRIDTFMASGKGGQSVNTTYSAVRITHIPTNMSVSCQNERSQSQNKDTAMKVLKSKLYQLMVKERAEKLSDIKGAHKSAEWGNQIRSYVLHPYKMVKDHRTDVETTDTEAVLGGELGQFMEAYLRQDAEERKKIATQE